MKKLTLGSINKFISKTLGNGLDVLECSLPGAGGQQPDGLFIIIIYWKLFRGQIILIISASYDCNSTSRIINKKL